MSGHDSLDAQIRQFDGRRSSPVVPTDVALQVVRARTVESHRVMAPSCSLLQHSSPSCCASASASCSRGRTHASRFHRALSTSSTSYSCVSASGRRLPPTLAAPPPPPLPPSASPPPPCARRRSAS
eukprot:2130401-Prymnesium_polylepis.1